MKKFKNIFSTIVIALSALATTACVDYRTIPISTVGKVVSSDGVSPEHFKPGKRDIGWAWKTKDLILLDTSVEIIPARLKIRLSDNQELDVEALVKVQLNTDDKSNIDGMFGMITPVHEGSNQYKIRLTSIYSKLNADLVRRTLVEVITPHTLESFQKERKHINDTIEKVAAERFKNTPLKLYTITLNKIGYPQSYIDQANKVKTENMKVDLKIAEEEAKRASLLEEEATVEIDKRVRLAKAETIRLENLKTAAGLNPMLLEYRKMELESQRLLVDSAFAEAAKTTGNSVIYYPVGQKPDYIETRLGRVK